MTRKIKLQAKNGDIDIKADVSVKFTGFMRETENKRLNELKDEFYSLLSQRGYHHSEIKIQ